ncbi:MAG: hypothetical protein B6I17_03560 [Tenericutes bacterium 4572_104]|nr:MAG: hypothetical protein B6I17_03560 [Tenericutes bacterium 4572_104]
MINQKNVEILFDYFDTSAILFYKKYKKTYLEGLVIACENLMANSIEDKYKEIKQDLNNILKSVSSIEFQKEEIRKAFQFACLRGFKHKNITNQMITPETIGIFVNYLIARLYDKQDLILLDPLVGTGNLITSIANNSNRIKEIIGIDNNLTAYQLSSALFDILNYGEHVFFQDTLTFEYNSSDVIVTDFSGVEEDVIYNIIEHYNKSIKSGGFLIGLFDCEVVEPEKLVKQSVNLNKYWKLFGMINLPKNILKNKGKCIVIFQREGKVVIQPSKFLLVDLPEFDKEEEMKHVINQINNWFDNTEFYKI